MDAGLVDLDPERQGAARRSSGSSGSSTAAAGSRIESKDDMRKRGVKSPDRADAAAMAYALEGHRPSVYRTSVRSFPFKPNGLYGPHTVAAVRNAKRRLGFPVVNGVAGRDFLLILEGKRPRPIGYLVRAGKRTKATVPLRKPLSSCVSRLISVEKHELGVLEHPFGSNDGPRVHVYQSATGVYRQAWCMSFQVWAVTGVDLGNVLEHTAGVYEETRWAKSRGLLHALPKVGSLVLFQDWGRPNGGHAGLVVKITAHGFVSIEGNASNGVRERYHLVGDRDPLFLWLPGCPS
jgi:hypothetical protein